jgi:CRISPR/Cas system CSM-associated protein Csm3 (group 7 of RAMP superfamily)
MRWIAEGTWITTSALHCGEQNGLDFSSRDMPVTRSAAGRFFIPAASLAGAARNYAGRRLMSQTDYEQSDIEIQEPFGEPAVLRNLFGSRMEYASALVVSDGELEGDARVALRDGVRIDGKTGLAHVSEDGGSKYDCEVVPAGTRFRLRFELRPASEFGEAERKDLLTAFGLVLQGFAKGDICLGARTRRGYGAGSVESWDIRRVETPVEYIAWLKGDKDAGTRFTLESLLPPSVDQREYLEVSLWLRIETSLLVRSAGCAYGDPDAVHLAENDRSILPGTSMAGVLRHRCERIANTFGAGDLVEHMFGPLKTGQRVSLRASRVHVDEVGVQDAEAAVHTRVAIDRFTQAALESKLFEEAPVFPKKSSEGHIRGLRIRLDTPRHCEADATSFEREAGLLLHSIKDLWLGDLATGGGAGVGRGVFRGVKAIFCAPMHFSNGLTMTAKGGGRGPEIEVAGDPADWMKLETWCRDWRTVQ